MNKLPQFFSCGGIEARRQRGITKTDFATD